jgi:hypothetical protein
MSCRCDPFFWINFDEDERNISSFGYEGVGS